MVKNEIIDLKKNTRDEVESEMLKKQYVLHPIVFDDELRRIVADAYEDYQYRIKCAEGYPDCIFLESMEMLRNMILDGQPIIISSNEDDLMDEIKFAVKMYFDTLEESIE